MTINFFGQTHALSQEHLNIYGLYILYELQIYAIMTWWMCPWKDEWGNSGEKSKVLEMEKIIEGIGTANRRDLKHCMRGSKYINILV